MKKLIIKITLFCFMALAASSVFAQSSSAAFHMAANLYVDGETSQALNTVNTALRQFPNDSKLLALKEKLEKQQQQDQKNQQNKDKDKKDQENKQNQKGKEERENQEQGEKDKQKEGGEKKEDDKKEEEKKDGEEKEGEEKDGEEKQPDLKSTEEKLKEMNISPEKAKMILEAMKSNEVQYLQQMKRKSSKRRDSDKPDW